MEITGLVRFPGNLDPTAPEFRPRCSNNNNNQVTHLLPPPPPPPPPPQMLPFCGGGALYSGCVELPPASTAPTRTLVLSSVPYEASESTVRRELEVFGEIRGVEMERLCDGIVTVHFYDLRHAQCALTEIREQHMQQQSRLRNHYAALFTAANSVAPLPPPARGLIAGYAVWAQFVVPAGLAVPDGHNQGTIVIFNLNPKVTTSFLKEIFEAFGAVKELRETPLKKHQRFVEFFDIRDAAKALREMNGNEIQGRSVVIEFSRPGGHNRKFAPANMYHRSGTSIQNYTQLPPPAKFSGYPASSNSSSPRSHGSQNSQHSSKKLGHYNGSYNSLIASMGTTLSLKVGINNRTEESESRKNKHCHSNGSASMVRRKQPQLPRIRPWKGRQGKKLDTRFLIGEDAVEESNSRDSRTTVMIKNIPNKYSQKLLLNMLDNHCIHCNEQIEEDDDQPLSAYDFVYLPIDFNNKCNVGYGFVNMTTPEATLRLYKAFHHHHWEVFNSRKICEVTYARVQGLEALKEHFKNSKFPCEMDHYLPVVFSPPRDGKQLTEPLAIAGQSSAIGLLYTATSADQDLTSDCGDCFDHQNDVSPKDDEEDRLQDCGSSSGVVLANGSSSNNVVGVFVDSSSENWGT